MRARSSAAVPVDMRSLVTSTAMPRNGCVAKRDRYAVTTQVVHAVQTPNSTYECIRLLDSATSALESCRGSWKTPASLAYTVCRHSSPKRRHILPRGLDVMGARPTPRTMSATKVKFASSAQSAAKSCCTPWQRRRPALPAAFCAGQRCRHSNCADEAGLHGIGVSGCAEDTAVATTTSIAGRVTPGRSAARGASAVGGRPASPRRVCTVRAPIYSSTM